jgi:hypothetical protein
VSEPFPPSTRPILDRTPAAGYVAVSPDLRLEVSDRIKEEFENGRN